MLNSDNIQGNTFVFNFFNVQGNTFVFNLSGCYIPNSGLGAFTCVILLSVEDFSTLWLLVLLCWFQNGKTKQNKNKAHIVVSTGMIWFLH